MASCGIHIGLLAVVLVSMLSGGALAQTSSCNNILPSLAPCLNYVSGNSSTPSSACCSQLVSAVQTSPQCLCQVLNGYNVSLGISINRTLALSLPGACKVQTPPISQCNAATAPSSSAPPPVTSPISSPPELSPAVSPATATSGSPTETSNETPEPSTTITPSASQVPSSSGTGSKTVPSTTATSSGRILKAPVHFLFFVFFVSVCGSTVTKF